MNDDLIKRSDAIEALGEEPYVWTDDDEFAQGERSQWIDDVSAIKAVQSVDIPHSDDWEKYSDKLWKNAYERGKADRPQGEWIDKGWKGDWQFETDGRGNCWKVFECSVCNGWKTSRTRFCPHCGARMKGADDE